MEIKIIWPNCHKRGFPSNKIKDKHVQHLTNTLVNPQSGPSSYLLRCWRRDRRDRDGVSVPRRRRLGLGFCRRLYSVHTHTHIYIYIHGILYDTMYIHKHCTYINIYIYIRTYRDVKKTYIYIYILYLKYNI